MKRAELFLVLVLTLLLALAPANALAADVKPMTPCVTDPANEYLSIMLNNTGRFTMGSVAGNFNIMYGWPWGAGSSYSTIRIDGASYIFGDSGTALQPPTDRPNYLNDAIYQIGDIRVKQELQIVQGSSSGRLDTGLIRYTVTNTGGVTHNVGARVMFDTMLADNDGAPFRLPGIGDVTTERTFTGSAIPQYWQAFNSLSNPNIMAQGTLIGGGATTPDKLTIAAWGNVYSYNWDYTANPSQVVTYDSGLAVYWYEAPLAAGATRTYTTFYGLGTMSGTAELSVTGPTSLAVISGQWSPNPFTVTAYIANNTGSTLLNVPAAITLPAGLGLPVGETATHTIPSIAPGSAGQTSWSVQANQAGSWTYSVTAQGQTVSRSVSVPVRDNTAPTSSAVQTPGPVNGWNKTDVGITINAVDEAGGSGVKEIHYQVNGQPPVTVTGSTASFMISAEGSNGLTYYSVDNAGNQEAVKSLTVRIDKTKPVSTATKVPPTAWATGPVTVNITGTDNLQGVTSISYRIDGGAEVRVTGWNAQVLVSTPGNHSVAFWSTDYAENVEDPKTIPVSIDVTPPAISYVVTPAANANGWHKAPALVTVNAVDVESGVKSITYSVDGVSQTVDGATAAINVAGEGVHAAQFSAMNNAGLSSVPTQIEVKIDATAPTLTGTRSPLPNGAGWNNTDVVVNFVASDALSGIMSPVPDVFVNGEGAGQSVTRSVSDRADNTATLTVSGINIDKTRPDTTCTVTPAPVAGWNAGPTTLKFKATDALSGVLEVTYQVGGAAPVVTAGDEAVVVVSAEGSTPVQFWAKDKAGNVEAAKTIVVKVDLTGPAVTSTQAPAPNGNGWNNSAVTVTINATDGGSGSGVREVHYKLDGATDTVIPGATATVLVSGEGPHFISYCAVDNVGNLGPAGSREFKIDLTPPVITGSRAPVANADGWNNTDVAVHFTYSDALSGILGGVPDVVVNQEGGGQSVTRGISDQAGNTASATVSGINIDKTAPAVTINVPASTNYASTDSITISYGVVETLSGVSSNVATLNGATVTNGQVISLAGKGGTNTFVVTVKDKAGNTTTKTVTFSVTVVATVDVNPDTLNVKSQSDKNAITAYIEFPAGYDVSTIDVASVKMLVNGVLIPAQTAPTSVGDYDGDGVRDRMVKFDRAAVIAAIGTTIGDIKMTVTGTFGGGAAFTGSDVVKVISPGK